MTDQPNTGKSKIIKLLLLLFFSICIIPFFSGEVSAQAKQAPAIHEVKITGNELVEESTIKYYLKTKAGDQFSVITVRKDIQKLYSLGFFDDIAVDVQEFEGRLIVTFMLKEKPAIDEVIVEGEDKISQEDIYKVLTVKQNTIINKKQIHESLEKVKSLYEEKGYYFAEVDYEVRELKDRRVEVLFKIDEGKKYKIKDIEFSGNVHLSDRQMKKVMEIKEARIWRTITSLGKAGKLVMKKLENDRRRLAALYAKYGFIEADIKAPSIDLREERGGIVITLTIVEGKQYKVGRVTVITDEEFPISELKEAFGLNEGDVFDGTSIPGRVRRLTEYYTERGYAFADVNPRVERRPEENLVDMSLVVEKGVSVKFGKVDIRGNEHTRDKVIRREIAMEEGALYDSSRIKKTRMRLQRLGYFSEAEVGSKKRPDEDIVDLEITVKEKQTGSFSGGGGFSSQQGVFVVGRVTQRNLFGRGWIISTEGILGKDRTDIVFSFTEPYFLDTRLRTSFEFKNRFEDFDTFDIDTLSGSLTLGYPLSDNLSVALGYSYEENEISDLDLSSEAQQILRVEEGFFVTSALLPSIGYNSLDSPMKPSRGLRVSLKNKISAKFLGSDLDYYRGVLETRYYIPVPKSILPLTQTPILLLRSVMGYAEGFKGDELPIYERFFLGGARSLRGFDFRDVGPADKFGQPLGGASSLLLSAELSYPVASIMDAVFFLDAGNVYLEGNTLDITDLRFSAGPGFKANTPFGQIAIFLGFKLDRKNGEKITELHFDMGRGF